MANDFSPVEPWTMAIFMHYFWYSIAVPSLPPVTTWYVVNSLLLILPPNTNRSQSDPGSLRLNYKNLWPSSLWPRSVSPPWETVNLIVSGCETLSVPHRLVRVLTDRLMMKSFHCYNSKSCSLSHFCVKGEIKSQPLPVMRLSGSHWDFQGWKNQCCVQIILFLIIWRNVD